MTKFYAFSVGCFALVASSTLGQITINEFTAANLSQTGFNGTGFYAGTKYHDWVELYNAGPVAVDLGGWHLSDKADNPTRFEIPAGTMIEAGGSRLFVCSGYGHSDPNGQSAPNAYGHVNTNFRLKQCSGDEQIILADPQGYVVDNFVLSNFLSLPNHSWGRWPSGNGPLRIMTNPTPGQPNAASNKYGYTAAPTLSQLPGYHPGPITLVMYNNQPGTVIRYTTNGSEPTSGSTVYTGPITISATTVVKARTFTSEAGKLPGLTTTATYFFGNDTHTLPVISISGNSVSTMMGGNQGPFQGVVEYFDAAGVRQSVTMGEMNKHGNDSWAYSQRGLDYIVRDEQGLGSHIGTALFRDTDRDKFQRVIIKCAANDNYPFSGGTHLRDGYNQSLALAGGLDLDVRKYEPVVLYQNGLYWGVYEIREKVDDPDYTRYYYNQKREHLQWLKTWGGTWTEYGNPFAQPQWNALATFVNGSEDMNESDYAYVQTQLNINSAIDHYIFNSYIVNANWLNWETTWWRGQNAEGQAQKWRYTLWDTDNTYGHGSNYSGIPSTGYQADMCDALGLGNIGGQNHIPIMNKLLLNDDFLNAMLNRYADLTNTTLNCEFMQSHLDSLKTLIEPEMPRQIMKWGGNLNTWQNEVEDLQDWIAARCSSEAVDSFAECLNVVANGLVLDISGVGKVQLNSKIIDENTAPWTGNYFSPMQITLNAIETDMPFAGWEVVEGKIIIENPLEPVTKATLLTGGEVKAHFGQTVPVPQSSVASVSLMPNPFADQLRFFAATDLQVQRLIVRDAAGQKVQTESLPNRQINTTGLSAGIYFFEFLMSDGSVTVLKAVKQ